MSAKSYTSYEQAAADYVAQFDAVLQVPPGTPAAARRGAGEVPVETLVQRADQIADISARMIPFARAYLDSPDVTLREGISGQLLAQAAAELEIASELLKITQETEGAGPIAKTRAARTADLQKAVQGVQEAMKAPPSAGLVSAEIKTRAASAATTPEEAKTALQETAETSVAAISLRVRELGGDIAFDLVIKTQWVAVLDGAKLLNKDLAAKLDTLKQGASVLIGQIVGVVAKTLLNVYEKLQALLGKDAEDQARKKIQEWLEKIKKDEKIDLFEKLVDGLYGVDAFKKEIAGCLAKTTATLDVLNTTNDEVGAVAEKFKVLAGYMGTLEDIVVAAKFIQLPQVLATVAGIQVLLLAFAVYAGYDYIGYKPLSFPNLTKGVGELVCEKLGC